MTSFKLNNLTNLITKQVALILMVTSYLTLHANLLYLSHVVFLYQLVHQLNPLLKQKLLKRTQLNICQLLYLFHM